MLVILVSGFLCIAGSYALGSLISLLGLGTSLLRTAASHQLLTHNATPWPDRCALGGDITPCQVLWQTIRLKLVDRAPFLYLEPPLRAVGKAGVVVA